MIRSSTFQIRSAFDISTRKYISTKVAVMMSGGIDSSVSAYLLKNQGFDIIGVFMRNWNTADEHGTETCSMEADFQDMKQVCDRLEIPSYDVEFSKEYWNDVFDPFLKSYQTGYETPNPDAMCNKYIKFKAFRHYVKKHFDIDMVATGHYAQLKNVTIDRSAYLCYASDTHLRPVDNQANTNADTLITLPLLMRGEDPVKDQSYFLSTTTVSSVSVERPYHAILSYLNSYSFVYTSS